METKDPRPSPQDLVSQDDVGLWIKSGSNPVTDHTSSPSVTDEEMPRNETEVNPSAVITRYYSVMDDKDADDSFIPPPSHMAPSLLEESSTDAMVNNPTVTFANWAADATEAKADPNGLDRHHGDKHLIAAQNKVDEVKASTEQTSPDTVPLFRDKDNTVPKDQDQTSMEDIGSLMETCYDPSRRHQPDITTGDEELNAEPEDIFSGGQENWRETKAGKDNYPKQVLSSTEGNFGNEPNFDFCDLAETNFKLTPENIDCEGVKTNNPTLSSLCMNDDDIESWGPSELCKCNQNWTETATSQPQVPEIPPEVSNEDEENVDSRPVDYKLTNYDWVRRESGNGEGQPRICVFEDSEEMIATGKQGDGSRRIATDIQQGEQLLQRLQQVQLRQDVHILESPHTSQQVVQEMKGNKKDAIGTEVENLKVREGNLAGGDEREENRSHTVDGEREEMNPMERKKNEKNESPTVPVEPEHHMFAGKEAGNSDDDQTDSWIPVELSPIDPYEISSTQIPFPSTHHRFSAAETAIERQIHEAVQEKKSLQRSGGIFNLADNPDVLEIPFKTNISLDTTTVAQPCQRSTWQFSEQKMQKEISQEIQRELVLVNQVKIPGGYSKGEVRQLKETKLLFEAFQQYNMEGPTRHRKSPTLLTKSHIYPSVMERTRSLEMFSLKSHPISRAHSLRLYKSTSDMEKGPPGFRSKTPTLGSQDKTHLFPTQKQDKKVCLYRSMDSISNDTTVMETGKTREGKTTQESPILKQNPFYKLRPALALQPEVEKDIREAKEREEDLRRQRCTLYGENRQKSEDGEKSNCTPTFEPG